MSETHNRPGSDQDSARTLRPSAGRRFATGVVVAVAGLSLLTGCAAGQHAQTAGQVPVADGVLADTGTIGIRNAGVIAPHGTPSYPVGSNASLELVIINNGTADDKLTSVSSTDAGSVVLSLDGAPQPSNTNSSSAGASDTATPDASSSSSASTSASASSSASDSGSSGTAASSITIPANSSVKIGYANLGASITLTGLTQVLFPAQSVPVTFTFASGAQISASLPVKLVSDPSPGPTVNISPSSEG